MSIFGIGKRRGIRYGKEHKGKTVGGISYTPLKVKRPKVKRVKLPPTLAQIRAEQRVQHKREQARRVSSHKTKRQLKRIWRRII